MAFIPAIKYTTVLYCCNTTTWLYIGSNQIRVRNMANSDVVLCLRYPPGNSIASTLFPTTLYKGTLHLLEHFGSIYIKSFTNAGYAAAEREKAKNILKLLTKVFRIGLSLSSFAMVVFGRWGKDTKSTLYNASKMAPLALGMSSTQFHNLLRRHLSLCLQTQIARS